MSSKTKTLSIVLLALKKHWKWKPCKSYKRKLKKKTPYNSERNCVEDIFNKTQEEEILGVTPGSNPGRNMNRNFRKLLREILKKKTLEKLG